MRFFFAVTCFASLPALAATYEVAPGGDDGNDGTTLPWATLQHAADTVQAGDTVLVRAGTYAGFYLETSGTMSAPIVFSGDTGAIVDQPNDTTNDGINLEGASWIVVEGFTVQGTPRAGIRAVLCDHVTIRGNTSADNGYWGILTGFCDDLLIEDNTCSGSIAEHGIYVSNSGDRPVVRNNRLFGNNANGLHMNGDINTPPGDGIISGAVVEQNVVWDNGVGGGSGINCDGVQDSIIRNNLIYDAHASGISLYRIDGGGPSSGNLVVHNTVVIAADGRWALNIQDGAANTIARNNILLTRHATRGSISIDAASATTLVSDRNIVADVFDLADTFMSLAEWRTATSQDATSALAALGDVFVDEVNDDYHLSSTSPALEQADSASSVALDVDGDPRPQGAASDIGADERCDGACVAVDGGAVEDDGGAVDDDGGGLVDDGGAESPDDGGVAPTDAGLVVSADGGADALVDGGGEAPTDGACACRAAGAQAHARPGGLALIASALVLVARRRR